MRFKKKLAKRARSSLMMTAPLTRFANRGSRASETNHIKQNRELLCFEDHVSDDE